MGLMASLRWEWDAVTSMYVRRKCDSMPREIWNPASRGNPGAGWRPEAGDGIHGLDPSTHLSLILIRAQTSDVNPQHDGAVGDSSPILLPDSGILESKRRPGKIIQ